MTELEEELRDYLIKTAAVILKCETSDVLWDSDIDEYGFASMEVNRFCALLNERLGIDTQPAIFLEITSLASLSHYLLTNYSVELEATLT